MQRGFLGNQVAKKIAANGNTVVKTTEHLFRKIFYAANSSLNSKKKNRLWAIGFISRT